MKLYIVGGTKGIGNAIVQAFLQEGVNVSFCSRTIRDYEAERREGAAKAIGTAVDIGIPSQIKEWVENSVKQLGPIDAVVANGEVLPSTRDLRNCRLTTICAQHALSSMTILLKIGQRVFRRTY